MISRIAGSLLFAVTCCAQTAPTLTIAAPGAKPLVLTAADLAAMEHIAVSYQDAGMTTTYEGVPVETLLKKAGAPLNLPHGGQTLRMAVSARASDGYQVVYSLAEFDSAIMATRPVVADQSGGKPLGEKVGPLRLIMPGEKKGARSVRMLEKLEVVDLSAQPAK